MSESKDEVVTMFRCNCKGVVNEVEARPNDRGGFSYVDDGGKLIAVEISSGGAVDGLLLGPDMEYTYGPNKFHAMKSMVLLCVSEYEALKDAAEVAADNADSVVSAVREVFGNKGVSAIQAIGVWDVQR